MPTIDYKGTSIELTEEGFLKDPGAWNEEIAAILAKDQEGQELTDEHWAVIRFIRSYYEENKSEPPARALAKGTGFKTQQILDLFPSGPVKGACKLAGLPKPDGCV